MPPSFPKPVQGRWGMVAQVASLLVTGVLVWNSAVRPQLRILPMQVVVGHALLYAVLAWFFGAVITGGLYLFVPRAASERLMTSTFRTAAVAVWFAPACILLSMLSPATLIAALLLVITATRLLYSEWVAGNPPVEPAAPAPPLGLFGSFTVKRPIVTRELLTGLAAAVALESGVVAVWKHHPLLAGFWFVLSASITTLFAMVSGAVEDSRPPTLPRSVIGMAMTVLLAAGLTIGGIRAVRGHGAGGGTGDGDDDGVPAAPGQGAFASAKEVLRDLFGDQDKPAAGMPGMYTPKPPPAYPGITPDGSFPGVILMPDVRPVTRIVAPPPKGLTAGMAIPRPYGIPFDGPYLLYRWPARRPPATSVLQRGVPTALAFSTTDHWALNMEAVQKFDEPIDLGCCRAVRMEIWNADRYPDTVSLDFYCASWFVGSAPVRSTPDLHRDPIVAVAETVEVPVAASHVCPEFKVVFRRERSRADKSARIALERFVLIP